MALRTRKLCAGSVSSAGPTSDIGIVPAGYRWLIKDASLRNDDTLQHLSSLYIRNAGSPVGMIISATQLRTGDVAFPPFQRFMVAEPGDIITLNASVAAVTGQVLAWVSGAQLLIT